MSFFLSFLCGLNVFQSLIIMLHFANPYPDHDGSDVKVSQLRTKKLIEKYVKSILKNKEYSDGDLYVGTSGIAAMFLKLHQSQAVECFNESALFHAKAFSDHSKRFLRNKPEDAASFLCGNAGIIAVSAVVNYLLGETEKMKVDFKQYLIGQQVCQNITFNKHGSDEILFGRAGYLSGICWLNQKLPSDQQFSPDVAMKVCDMIITSGVQYSNRYQLTFPLMWECYGDRYLGAAHGVCSILHMLLESPLFSDYREFNQLNEKQQLVKITIDMFLEMQAPDGNFPAALGEARKGDHKLIHWCHGAPGAIYLLAKSYRVFNEQKYLKACVLIGELIWKKGLLRKGPGICHGVAGNGYVFLVLFRLTNEQKYLYRASKFADFLTDGYFVHEARTPDRPLSLYEGVAGTVCFLIDLLQPYKASFPFMDVFERKF